MAGINRQELQQVLINLLVDAAQAMPEGRSLVERYGGGLRVEPGAVGAHFVLDLLSDPVQPPDRDTASGAF